MRKILTLLMLCCGGLLVAQNYKVGDLYTAPDGSLGIVYYVHPEGNGGWVVALNDASEGCPWGGEVDVPGLTNLYPNYIMNYSYLNHLVDTSGYANTQAIRDYQNNDPTYAAGLVDFDNGWYIPSTAQISLLYGQLPFITNALVDAGGTSLANGYYWSSSERNASMAWQLTTLGGFEPVAKNTSCRVRAVRSYTVTVEPEMSYSWSTGATTPDITVSPAQTTTYTVTVTSLDGCSDTVTHTITMISAEPQTFVAEVCQGEAYEDNGFSLTAAETSEPGAHTYTRVEYMGGGCAVTHTLELMVNPSPHSEFVDTACGSFAWEGETYTQSGDYTNTYPLSSGCDSVVTLHLTIFPMPEVSIEATSDTICDGNEAFLQALLLNTDDFLPQPVAVGDILCTDGFTMRPEDYSNSGKTAMGVVFYVDNTGKHGWAVHLQDQLSGVAWNGDGIDIPDLNNYSNIFDAQADYNGYANTQIIRAAGDASVYPVAWSMDFDHGWYLPAVGQLNMLLSEIVVLNPSLQLVGGDPFSMYSTDWYWSSTEESAGYAWVVNLSCLGSLANNKYSSGSMRARGVINF